LTANHKVPLLLVSLSTQKCALLKEKSNKKEKGNNNSNIYRYYVNTNLKDGMGVKERKGWLRENYSQLKDKL